MPNWKAYRDKRKQFLKTNFPKHYRDLEKAGQLEAHLDGVEKAVEETYDAIQLQVSHQKIPGESYMDRVNRLEQIPILAEEMINHDHVLAPGAGPSQA